MPDRQNTQIRTSLTSLSSFLAHSTLLRHLFFFALTCIAVFLSGYYFGTFDQSIHIPFLKKDTTPFLYPGDPFFELRQTHFSYFWYLFQPFYKIGMLEISLFLVHLSVTYLTFWAIWRLSDTLFKNKKTTLLCTAAFLFPHIGFAAFPVFEFSLLNRTFVLPFLLLSIDWYLKKEYIKSFILLGVLYNLHALSVTFVVFMYSVDLLVSCLRERMRLERKAMIGASFFLFILFSLPVLLWKFGKSPLDLSLRPEWFGILSDSLMYTIFYPLSTSPSVLLLSISGCSVFFLYFLSKKYALLPYSRVVNNFMYAAIGLILLAVAVSLWLPITLLVQFQIIRIGVFALLFGYLYFIHSIVKRYEDNTLQAPVAGMLYVSVLVSPLPLIPLFVNILVRFLRGNVRLLVGWIVILVSFLFCAWLSFTLEVWRPGIQIFQPKSAWVDVQLWAKDNSTYDAIFITPPENWWFFEPDWRVFSERSTISTLSEVLEFAFTPEYTEYWKDRFEAVAPGALGKFSGDIFASRILTEKAYRGLSDDAFLKIAAKYKATYIVVKKPRVLPLQLVYENKEYAVYKVPVLIASGASEQEKLTTGKIFHTIE